MPPYERITESPHWEWWLVFYFFLGGIAGGAYFIAALIELIGTKQDRQLAKVAYYISMPIILLCTVFLILDLGRPERFWHMIIQSETFRPMFKYWSPMSYGSWILSVFGAFAGLSFVGVLIDDNRFGLGRFRDIGPFKNVTRLLHEGPTGFLYKIIGLVAAFGLASYTGSLLSASNVPFWSDSDWLGALFFASGASTGIATMILLQRRAAHESVERLEMADAFAIGLELLMITAFLISLGGLAGQILSSSYGILLLIGTVLIGLIVPLALRFRPRLLGNRGPIVAAALVLVGGFVLRYSILMAGQHVVVPGR